MKVKITTYEVQILMTIAVNIQLEIQCKITLLTTVILTKVILTKFIRKNTDLEEKTLRSY